MRPGRAESSDDFFSVDRVIRCDPGRVEGHWITSWVANQARNRDNQVVHQVGAPNRHPEIAIGVVTKVFMRKRVSNVGPVKSQCVSIS